MPTHKQEMESQIPPSKIARLADSSMERNGSPPIGLGLALGRGVSIDHRHHPQRSVPTKSNGFTILQMQELQLQTLIYKYIEAGIPVPYHLVLPIWKSVSGSHSTPSSNIYQLYPPFMRGSPLQMEHRNGMDPEPGRCRRTDGKKWRCSKEALPDQKYCERHMHRGRQRTRKLMEVASQMNMNSSDCASTNLSICLPSVSTSSTVTNLSPTSSFYSNAVRGDFEKN